MIVYVIAYFILCTMSLASMRLPEKKRRLSYWIGCGILLFLMCFRDISVGADTENYCSTFLSFRENTWSWCFQDVSWEWGFVILMKLLGYVVPSANGFIIVMGLINLLPLMFLIRYSSKNPLMSLILFFAMLYTAAEYLYRQWFALLILLLSYRFVVERKPIQFLISIAIAAFFHRTSVLFIVVYVLYCFNIKNWMLLLALVGSIFLAVTGDVWFKLANLVARIPLKNVYNGGVTMMLFLWFCVLAIYFISRRRLKDPYFKLHFILLLIAAATQPIAFTFSLWSRIVLYFRISLIFLLPQTVSDFVHLFRQLTIGAFIRKIENACQQIPLLRKISFANLALPAKVEGYHMSKLVIPVYAVFYLLLCIYFCANGMHGFKLMQFF